LDQLEEKYCRQQKHSVTWECAALEVCPHDPVFDLNTHGENGWEPMRPINKKVWLFKRPIVI
jgi:hypothetical protein